MATSNIPVNSLSRHVEPLREQLAQTIGEVIDSGYFVLGPSVKQFEQAFADYCGTAHCIGVANGTDALELSLRALGIGPGDYVALTANAAMYGTSAVLNCGGAPVFIEVEPGSSSMDPSALAEALVRQPDIKAVIVTHLYGRLARVDELVQLCRARQIGVIEDCAQAHGASLPDGRRAGSFGDLGCFSFYPTKNLGALGDGGAVVTGEPELAERVAQLRQYGWTNKYTNGISGGRNSRLDEIQARILLLMLPMLDGWNRRRRAIGNRYSQEIIAPGIILPPVSGSEYVAHLYVVRSARRDELRVHLAAEGIQTDVHYPVPDHRQPCHQGRFDKLDLPETELDAKCVLTLPCFPELGDEEVSRVIDACNRF